MVKTGVFISKKISNISKINFSWNLTLIVFAVSIIQLPSRKGARYGFNVPKPYLKTKPKYEHDEKYFKEPWDSSRIFWSMIMKYCYIEGKRYWCIEFALPKN